MLRQEFLQLCREKYGDAFEYPSLPEDVKRNVISIICKKHGKVEMIARDHLRTKHGCPRCAGDNKRIPSELSNERWMKVAKQKFSEKFNYEKVDLKVSRNHKVEIICPTHGSFKMSLRCHFHTDTGCPKCGNALNLYNRTRYKTLDDVVEVSRKVHGLKFTYLSFCVKTKMLKYACPSHGEKQQPLSTHLTGRGCWECGRINRTITVDEFLLRAKQTHPTGYSYSLSELKTVNDKITIFHECGRTYKGRVSNHLAGQGCMGCKSSLGEIKIKKFLEINGIQHREQFKIDGYSYRYDFYLPELNILIEYDGEQHFRPVEYFGGLEAFYKTQERDQMKVLLAEVQGMILIRIPYNYFDNLEVYLSRAIDRHFSYRVNSAFYRNMISLCTALGLPQETSLRDLEHYRTFNVLKPV